MKIDSVLDWNANYNEGENRLPDWVEEIIDQLIDSNDEHETAIAELKKRADANADIREKLGFTVDENRQRIEALEKRVGAVKRLAGEHEIRLDKLGNDNDLQPQGSWVCQECKKDWGDGRSLFVEVYEGKPPYDYRKGLAWWCTGYPDKLDEACGAHAVKWQPSPESDERILFTDERDEYGVPYSMPNQIRYGNKEAMNFTHEAQQQAMRDNQPDELKPCPLSGNDKSWVCLMVKKLRTELADAEYRYETASKALDMTIEERDAQVDEIERLSEAIVTYKESVLQNRNVVDRVYKENDELKADNEKQRAAVRAQEKTIKRYKDADLSRVDGAY